jgi:hypothetical protein
MNPGCIPEETHDFSQSPFQYTLCTHSTTCDESFASPHHRETLDDIQKHTWYLTKIGGGGTNLSEVCGVRKDGGRMSQTSWENLVADAMSSQATADAAFTQYFTFPGGAARGEPRSNRLTKNRL